MISVQVVGDRELITRLTSLPSVIRQELIAEMRQQGYKLQRHVQVDKLSGQVLNVVTGVLRSSINLRLDQQPTSIVASVGTNIRYAAVHEYGFDGTVNVRAHERIANNIFGTGRSAVQQVSAHVRHMRMPVRSFLRSALADLREEITAGMAAAVRRAIEK